MYADLDKSAMSEGEIDKHKISPKFYCTHQYKFQISGKRPSVTIENEKSEYAEISPQAKEWRACEKCERKVYIQCIKDFGAVFEWDRNKKSFLLVRHPWIKWTMKSVKKRKKDTIK